MEELLENNRFSARFNAGESGHRPQTLRDLIHGLQPSFNYNLSESLLQTSLSDPPNMGTEELRREVASLHPGATQEHVLITTGTSEAFFLLMRQLRPKKVALITPAFQLLTEIPRSLNAQIINLPVQWDTLGKPHAPVDEWIVTIDRCRPDILILNHPHNPTGLTLTEQQLERLTGAAEEAGCKVVGDEHYRFLHKESALGPTVFREGRFVTGSFIKCCGTPGLRVGWCVGDPAVVREMQSEKNYTTHTVNPLVQKLSFWFLYSLSIGGSYFQSLRTEWLANRDFLTEWLLRQNLWMGQAPEGGLVSCLFPNPGNADALRLKLEQERIFLLSLSSFREYYVGWPGFLDGYRLGLGMPHDHFKQMLSVMVL